MKEFDVDNSTKIYKRIDKPKFWQVLVRSTITKKTYRRSTKETNKNKAIQFAKNLSLEIYKKETVGAVVDDKNFNYVAKQYLITTQQQIENGTAKQIHAEYIHVIQTKFLPFFGKMNFNAITQVQLNNYIADRTKKLDKKISRTRQQTEVASWNALQQFAIENNYTTVLKKLPTVKVAKGSNRLAFNKGQQKIIRTALDNLTKEKSKNKTTAELRLLLNDYYYLLLHSAIRVGLEMMRVRYSSFEYKSIKELDSKKQQQFFSDDDELLYCYLKEGETKTFDRRTVLIRTSSKAFENALLRVASRTENTAEIYNKHHKKNKLKTYVDRKNCLKELFKSDEFVIRLGNETGVLKLNEVEQRKRMTRLSENTSKAFNKLLKAVELYEDKNGDKRSLYSIRHTYGTEMLEEGESLELVAKEMGNSSKVLDKYYNKVNVSSSAFTLSGKKAQQNFNNKDLEKLSRAELIKLLS